MKTITIGISGYDIKITTTEDNVSMSERDFAYAILTKVAEAIEELKDHHGVSPPRGIGYEAARKAAEEWCQETEPARRADLIYAYRAGWRKGVRVSAPNNKDDQRP
jgi:hypothetical protein